MMGPRALACSRICSPLARTPFCFVGRGGIGQSFVVVFVLFRCSDNQHSVLLSAFLGTRNVTGVNHFCHNSSKPRCSSLLQKVPASCQSKDNRSNEGSDRSRSRYGNPQLGSPYFQDREIISQDTPQPSLSLYCTNFDRSGNTAGCCGNPNPMPSGHSPMPFLVGKTIIIFLSVSPRQHSNV